ncbi:MAG TPA: glycoside hydrolase family 38 C-terminal domain-containing protein [Gemmatimonadales bacterium]
MPGLVFHLVPHTHWDREWYLPHAAFRVRLIDMMDDLLERLQDDQVLRSFLLDGQTVLLEDYLRARPERDADIRALVKTGRLQVGPWYVLADEQVPSGEAMIRNLLLGGADAERLGGRLDVLYSPDAFGHPPVLPSLAREFGIKYAVVWRGLGGEPGQERDFYRWRAPDGRDVLLWHLPPAGYEIGAALAADALALAPEWARVRTALVERAATKHVAVFIGADHHATHAGVSRVRELIAALEPDGAVRVSRLDEFLQTAAAQAATAPVLEGELRWSYRYAWTLQGVHGTRLPLKRRNSTAELWLARYAEPLAALARRAGDRDRRAALELAWRDLVRCQFHDTISGCVSDEVALAVETRLGGVEAAARELVRASVYHLVGHDPDAARQRLEEGRPSLALWNPAARARGGVVIADVSFFRRDVLVGPTGGRGALKGSGFRSFAFEDADGDAVPVQVLGRRLTQERLPAVRHHPDQDEVEVARVAFRATPVSGLGVSVLTTRAGVAPLNGDGAVVKGRVLLNQYTEVTLEPNGGLALLDRRAREWFLDVLRVEDDGDAGDAYTHCPARTRSVRAEGPLTVRRLAAGPLVAALEARFALRGRAAVRLVIALHADSPVVRCFFDVDNQATNHRLRARLPLRLGGEPARAGAAFGAVPRQAVRVNARDYPLETPVTTAPAHRFVAVARGRRGLALLAPGFFEYEWTPEGDLLYTILRGVGELSRSDLPTRPGHAAWPTETPLAQCPGHHRIELGLAPVSAADLERGDVIEHLWEDTFLPLRGFWLRDAATLAGPGVDIALEGEGLVFSCLKSARVGGGTVVRCFNVTDRPVRGAWRFGEGVRTAHRIRADERDSEALAVEDRGKTVPFDAGPHEIVTILIT